MVAGLFLTRNQPATMAAAPRGGLTSCLLLTETTYAKGGRELTRRSERRPCRMVFCAVLVGVVGAAGETDHAGTQRPTFWNTLLIDEQAPP